MSFMTVLEKVGSDIVKDFKVELGIAQEVQTVAAPFESLINPGLPALVNLGINAIANTEALAAAAGAQNGTGAVKLASVIASLSQTAAPTLQALGVNPATVTSTQWTTFVNALVSASNAFITTQTGTGSVNPAKPLAETTNVPPPPAPATGAAIPGK